MSTALQITFASAILAATPALAHARDAHPSRSEVMTAIDRTSEDQLLAELQKYAPGTAAGHVIQVKGLNELVCADSHPTGSVDCHFVVHREGRTEYHVATLTLEGGEWRIVSDHQVIKSAR